MIASLNKERVAHSRVTKDMRKQGTLVVAANTDLHKPTKGSIEMRSSCDGSKRKDGSGSTAVLTLDFDHTFCWLSPIIMAMRSGPIIMTLIVTCKFPKEPARAGTACSRSRGLGREFSDIGR